MVGRMQEDNKTQKGKLLAWGVGTSKDFEDVVEKINKKYDFSLNKVKGGTGPSDHDSFYRKKIPVLFFWTGTHKDYHRPTDTAENINYKDMLRLIDFSEEVLTYLTTTPKRPDYVQVAGGGTVRPVGKMPRLGVTPAYESEKKGLLVEAVSPGGPAAKAGLKGGDLITAISGQEVTNIQTYMVIMQRQKAGQPVLVTVERGKQKLTMKVTPE
jgi:C-terminal processing protease CtpA/Prc